MILSNTRILLIFTSNIIVSVIARDVLVKKYGNILNLMEEFLSEPNFSDDQDFPVSIKDLKSCLSEELEAPEEYDEQTIAVSEDNKDSEDEEANSKETPSLEQTLLNLSDNASVTTTTSASSEDHHKNVTSASVGMLTTASVSITHLNKTNNVSLSNSSLSLANGTKATNHTADRVRRDVADTIIDGLFDVSKTINSQNFDSTYLKQLLRDNAVGKERKKLKNQLLKVLKLLMMTSFKVGIQHPEDLFLQAINN